MATSGEFMAEEEDKELLLCRVNELVFVDALAGYECRRCERTLIRHYLAPCGHYFCPNCKRLLLQSKSNCPLPACRQPLEDMDFQDIEFERKLYKLRAHCPNKVYGCPFLSQLKDLGAHLKMCKDTRDRALPVLIQGNNFVEAILRDLSIKVDKLSADINAIKEETSQSLKDMETRVDNKMKDIETQVGRNKRELDKKMVEVFLKLHDYEAHKTEVNKANVETKVDNDGFLVINPEVNLVEEINRAPEIDEQEEVKVEAKERVINLLDKIEEMNKKMAEMMKKLDEKANKTEIEDQKDNLIEISRKLRISSEKTSEQNNKMARQMEFLKQETEIKLNLDNYLLLRTPQMSCVSLVENDKCHNAFTPDFTWKITGIKEKMKELIFEIKSASFKWTGYPSVQAQAQLEVCEDGQANLSLCLNKKNKAARKAADLELIPAVYYVLKDQSGGGEAKHKTRMYSYSFSNTFNPALTFQTPFVHKSWLTHPSFNVDDSIAIEIYVEPPSTAQTVYSYDGTLTWAIDNYRKRKRMEKENSVWYQESPYFYTGPSGYRVQVRMCLVNGLRVNVRFLTGAFDAVPGLPVTFPHRTTVTIFNRPEPKRNIVQTVVKDIEYKREYFIDMCKDEDVENVAENDTIFYKVSVKPDNNSNKLM